MPSPAAAAAEKRIKKIAKGRRVLAKLGAAVREQRAIVRGRAHTGGKRAEFELGFIASEAASGVLLIDSRFSFSARFDSFAEDKVYVDMDGTRVQCIAVVTEEVDGTVAVRIDACDDGYEWFWLTVSG